MYREWKNLYALICLGRMLIWAIKEVGLTLVQCTLEFVGTFNFGVDKLNRIIVSSWFLKITNIVKPAPFNALRAFKVFVKLSQVAKSCHKLSQVVTSTQWSIMGQVPEKKIWFPKNVQENSILIFFDHEIFFFFFSDPYKLVKIMFCHVGP